MRALGRFGRFTLFHHLSHHPMTLAVFLFVLLVFGLFGLGFVVCFVVFCFLFASVMEFLNPPRVLDLDDRQGLIASSAMQLKKK